VSANFTIALVASVSVGFSAPSRRFLLFGCAKIGARAQMKQKCLERAEKRTKTLAMQANSTTAFNQVILNFL